MARKQKNIPGTEREEIEYLTKAAEAYRKTVAERMALQRVESDQKAHLLRETHRAIKEKLIKGPPKDSIEPVTVYVYDCDDGNPQDVKFAYGKETIKVNKSKNGNDEE